MVNAKRKAVEDRLLEIEEEAYVADGFDDAIIGLIEKSDACQVVYSTHAIIDILCEDMDYESAWEYFEFNVRGSYIGSKEPLYMDLIC